MTEILDLINALLKDRGLRARDHERDLRRVREQLLNMTDDLQHAEPEELEEVVDEQLRVLDVLIDALEDFMLEEEDYEQQLLDRAGKIRTLCEYEAERVTVINRDHPKVHKAVEEISIAQKERCERVFQGRFICQTPGCYGELWCEYIENERYLVKCSRQCRIVWIWARSPKQALERASAPALKPLSEWDESENPFSLWWPMQNPQEPAHYVGDPRCDDWDDERYKFFIPHPPFSRTPEDEVHDPENESLYH